MKLGTLIQVREIRLGNPVIWNRACGYIELSEVRHSYAEYSTPNIGTIRSPSRIKSYSSWNRVIHAAWRVFLKLKNNCDTN